MSGSFAPPNTGSFAILTANEATITNTLHLVTTQARPQFKEITRTAGDITRISIYTNSSKTTELYRKTFAYSGGELATITEVDYTRSPNVTRTKTFTRTLGDLVSIEVA